MYGLILIMACQTEHLPPSYDSLPPKSTLGLNTLGCLLNDSLWLPSNSSHVPSLISNWSNGNLYIYAENQTWKATLTLQAYGIFQDGVYDLETIDCEHRTCSTYIDESGLYEVVDGELLISRLDTLDYIVSGEFYFTAESSEGSIVKITEGRFDINYSGL